MKLAIVAPANHDSPLAAMWITRLGHTLTAIDYPPDVDTGLDRITQSDAVVALDGWVNDPWCAAEIAYAIAVDMPIYRLEEGALVVIEPKPVWFLPEQYRVHLPILPSAVQV